ncbi:Retrovirus-related Pol polyprotein from transposon [Trichinella patagoniensis]|uniref:Retrovirus-related Pol polyprotein from transposon n=1 Tax=Trichinella patagoniensis TaxID=990121 RepID=A0A0V0ZCU7_9BILA|nr:Retrovirus-related Pol polyprotein from transposon [Trichinella patagoniensis]
MPSTRSATSYSPEENRQQLEVKAGTLQMGACPGNGHSILPVAVPPTCWRPPVLFSSGTEPNRWITSLEKLDLASGYWQVEVDKRDREKTAFATPLGLYQFKVMPFRLCNAPGTFQRLMERTLSGLVGKSCLVYLDDIIVFSATEEEHLT